ncbi:hypothetical protein DEI86_07130 [Curtobacterium sp. MCBD17_028]|nr:hypothetical protein DEI86_07130 [Curtobacterium sp. MCBD17_028]
MWSSRASASKWVNRSRVYGEAGLEDPAFSPASVPDSDASVGGDWIEQLRRTCKHSARRIVVELAADDVRMSVRNVRRRSLRDRARSSSARVWWASFLATPGCATATELSSRYYSAYYDDLWG